MDYYDISCELDKIHSKIECFAEMMGTLASAESDNGASGTFWFIHDVARGYAKDLYILSSITMDKHKEIAENQFKQETKKGKK
jgi:hypothetical protein